MKSLVTEAEHRRILEVVRRSWRASYRPWCDCEGWSRQNGVVFDTQDLRESGASECPCCGRWFGQVGVPAGVMDSGWWVADS